MVVGDQRKFVVALLVPNPVTVESKAAEQGITFTSNKEMVAHPWVRKLIEDEVARLTTHLAQWETIKRFALLPDDFTFDNGGLTFTMKLKRRVVEQKYRDVISPTLRRRHRTPPHPPGLTKLHQYRARFDPEPIR